MVLVVKNPSANAGEIRDSGSLPGSGRSNGGGHVNPLQYSCLENPMDRGASQAIVHQVAKSLRKNKMLYNRECVDLGTYPCSIRFKTLAADTL